MSATQPLKASEHARRRGVWALLAALSLLAETTVGVLAPAGHASATGSLAAPQLSSDAVGALTVAWDAPSPAPVDYRVMWAPVDGEWLSFDDVNEAERGNLYPGGDESSVTITGLTPGGAYKVQMRARYGDSPPGPFSPASTLEVRGAPQLSSDAVGALTVAWDAPSPAPVDYRVMWAPVDGEWLSFGDVNEAERGNLYPGGDEGSVTITGLTPGGAYKVQMRARYGDSPPGPWSTASSLRVLEVSDPVEDGDQVDDGDPDEEGVQVEDGDPEPDEDGVQLLQDTTPEKPADPAAVSARQSTEAATLPGQGVDRELRTLVGNLQRGQDQDASATSTHAQGFRTGANASGYTLTGVQIGSDDAEGDSFGAAVYTLNNGNPDTEVVALVAPSDFTAGPLWFAAPDNTTLTAGTDYGVVVTVTGNVTLDTTRDNGEDPGGASGWSLGNDYRFITSSNNWAITGSGESLRVSLRGYANPTALVSNLTQGSDASVAADTNRLQGFTTGSNASGYTLTGVTIDSEDAEGDSFDAAVHTLSSGTPDELVATLTRPSSFTAGNLLFTASSPVYLDPGTEYGVVLTISSSDPVTLDTTTSDGEDSGGASGWSLGNDYRLTNSSNIWAVTNNGQSLRVAVQGYANPPAMVSNLGQGSDASAASDSDRSQGFKTGLNAPGYTLTGVVVDSEDADGDEFGVEIHTLLNGAPSERIATLAAPSDFAAGNLLFTASPPLSLESNTEYGVVMTIDSANPVTLDSTTSDGEDSSSAPNWSLGNDYRFINSSNNWAVTSNGQSLRVAILGYADVSDLAAPGPPTGLTATSRGPARINLSWSAPADDGGTDITGYRIEVSTNGADWTDLVADTADAATTYEHTGLTLGSTRHYRVSAINEIGTSTPSGTAMETTSALTVPGTPTGLTATARGPERIGLSWSAPADDGGADITGYRIEVSTDGADWTDLVASHTATNYLHTGLALGDTRRYRVSAINSEGTGAASGAVTATTRTLTVPGQGLDRDLGVLISNLAREQDKSASATSNHAQGFTTGANASGYTLTGVQIASEDAEGDSFGAAVYTLSNGSPDTEVVALVASSDFTAGPVWFAAPDNTTLDAGTEYGVVVTVTGDVTLDTTEADDEDPEMAAGWSLGNDYRYIDSSGDWAVTDSDQSLRVSLRGYANPTPLVSNLTQGSDASAVSDTNRSQGFTTGSNATGYTFTGVTVDSEDAEGDSFDAAVHTLSNGAPDVLVATLTRPSSFAAGNLLFTTSSPVYLDPGTEYGLVLTISASNPVTLDTTTANDEDSGGASGWSLGNDYRLADALGNWTVTDDGQSLRVAVRGWTNPPALISNLAQGSDADAASGTDRSQGFRTGPNAPGYTLTGVVVDSEDAEGDEFAVAIYTLSNGAPDTETATLVAPADFAPGHLRFTASPPLALDANTEYGVVMTVTDEVTFDSTTSDDEDSGGASGWNLGNDYRLIDTSDNWAVTSNGQSLRVAVLGYADVSDAVAPDPPTALSATGRGPTRIDLSWEAPADDGGALVTGYKIEVSTDGAAWTDLVADTASTATAYSHTGLTLGSTRHYRVSAINSVGAGMPSGTAMTTTVALTVPGRPTGLTAVEQGPTRIDLSWEAPAADGGADITGYKIEVSTDGATWTDLVADTSDTATAYSHTGLAEGDTRHYRVSAINSEGAGTASDTATETTRVLRVPGKPTGLTAAGRGPAQINLSWEAPADDGGTEITGYQIEASADGSNWTVLVASHGVTGYSHVGLAAGSTRHYRVSAINSKGAGTASDAAMATTRALTAPAQGLDLDLGVLVGNLTQGSDASAASDSDRSQGFTTGPNSGGYMLTGVVIDSQDAEGDSFGAAVYTLDNGAPDTLVATLIPPSDFTAGPLWFAASPAVALNAATEYGVVMAITGSVTLDSTTSDSEDSGGAAGWSLGNDYRYIDSSGSWAVTSNGQSLRVSLRGYANPTALISNLGRGQDQNAPAASNHSQGFTTGADPGGYTLTGVVIDSEDAEGDSFGAAVYTLDNGSPDTLVATLTAPSDFAAGNLLFTAPPALVLDPSTEYGLVVTVTGNVTLDSTSDDGEDPGGASGWNLGNDYRFIDSSNNWAVTSSGESLRVAIRGYPNPPPLVSNRHQGSDAGAASDSNRSQGFTTGPNVGGYTLTGVVIDSEDAEDDSFIAAVYTLDNGAPDELVTTLTPPADFTAGPLWFAAPPRLSLDPSTEYGVVIIIDGANPVTLDSTTSDSEDSGAAPSWSLGNDYRFIDSSGSWAVTGDGESLRVAVWGYRNVVPFIAPGPPSGLTAIGRGPARIRLSWEAPGDDGGADISGYKIEVSTDGAAWTDLVADTSSTDTTYSHTGLTLGSTRHYRVSAVNAAGPGTPSGTASATTRALTLPGQPTGLTASSRGPTLIRLSWEAPDDGGADISGYKIEVSSDGTTWTDLVASHTGTTYSHTNLTQGDTRHYRVSAITSVGTGTASATAMATTRALAAPGKPTGLTATKQGKTRIDLSWEAPADDGGADISGYKIEVSSDGSTWTDLVASQTATTYSHTGLTAGSTRHYRVSAINSQGAGTASDTAMATTDAPDPPGKPTNLRAVAPGLTQIDLSWTRPSDAGDAAISGYKIEVSTDGTTWTDLVASQTATMYSHTGLTAGDTRHYRVSAISSVGTGEASDEATETTDAYLTNFGQSPTNSALLSWGRWGQGFTTGTHAAGYILTAIDVVRTDSANFTITGELWAAEEATTPSVPDWIRPTSELFDLNAAGSPPGTVRLSAPSNRRLLPGTSYALIVRTQGTSDVYLATTGTGEDTGGGTGWSIDDTRTYDTYGGGWDRIGVNGGTYRIKVRAETAAATAPFRPTGLTATQEGSSQIDLSWTAPFSGGADISGYKIEVSTDGTTWTDLVASTGSTATTYSHTGLSEGDTRHYRVSAINSVGTSPASDTAMETTFVRTVPDQPTGLKAIASGPAQIDGTTQIDLSWTAPFDGGADITGYRLEVSTDGTNWTDLVASQTATSYSHTNLAAGSTRHYRVTAINVIGSSPTSAVVTQTTNVLVSNAGQGSLASNDLGAQSHSQAFTTGASPGGFPLAAIDFVSEDADGDDFSASVWSTDSDGLPLSKLFDLTAPGSFAAGPVSFVPPANTFLSAATTYAVVVTREGSGDPTITTTSSASEDAGAQSGWSVADDHGVQAADGAWSSATGEAYLITVRGELRAATVPFRTTGLSAWATGPAQIRLSWTEPSFDGGADITGYRIEVSTDGTTWTDLVASTGNTDTAYSHTGLAAGSTRHYRVSAISSEGTGPVSNVATDTTNVLVSNLLQGEDTILDTDGARSHLGQIFQTGDAPYLLEGIDVISEDTDGDDFSVQLWQATSAQLPDTAVTPVSLTSPSSFAAGLLRFTAPANTRLSANTRYAVVIVRQGSEEVTLDATTSDNEDAGKVSGWDIRWRSAQATDNGASWTQSGQTSLRIAIRGTLPQEAPGKPTGLTALRTQPGNRLSWSPPDYDGNSPITGYKIELSTDGTNWTDLVADTGTAYTSYMHRVTDASTTRHYRVSAINTNGTGTASDAATAGATAGVLVSNTGKGNAALGGFIVDHAQAFTTGSHRSGYKLTEIGVTIQQRGNPSQRYDITIHNDNSGVPGSSIGTFTQTGNLTANTVNTWRNSSGVDLSANTTYFVWINGVSGVTTNLYNTGADSEDSGAAQGWSIGDTSLYKNLDATSWTTFAQSKKIALRGYPKIDNAAPVFGSTAVTHTLAENTAAGTDIGTPVSATDADLGDLLVATLTAPSDFSAGPLWFAAPADTTLDANTPYSVVVSANADVAFDSTTDDAEDAGGIPGWSLDDAYRHFDAAGAWADISNGQSLRMSLRGHASAGTLISNLAQGSDTSAASDTNRSQGFTTGPHGDGYTLTGVTVASEDADGDSFGVEIHTLVNGAPGSRLATLTPPSDFAAGNLQFTASPALELDPSTEYGVVITIAGSTTVTLDSTSSDREDSGGAGGWNLGNDYRFINSSDNWAVTSSRQSLRVELEGYPNPPRHLISNLAQGSDASAASDTNRSQGFTTGPQGGGYTLTGVVVASEDADGDSFGVEIHTLSNGAPDTRVATLTAPSDFTAGEILFTASPAVSLNPSTEYGVVITIAGSTTVTLDSTSGNDEDSGGAEGWNLGNDYRLINSSDNWAVTSNGQSLRVAIVGYADVGDSTPTLSTPVRDLGVLTSNVNRGSDRSASVPATASQGFRTGAFGGGYTLTGVQIDSDDAEGDSFAAAVYELDGDSPPVLHYSLSGTDAASFDIVSHNGQLQTKEGVSYDYETKTSYSVTVNAYDGTETASVPVTITITDRTGETPSAPAAPTVAAVAGSGTSLSVSWVAPDNAGNPAITGYDLRYRSGSGAWSDGPQDVSGLTATLTGLTASTDYQVQVRATNADGDSAWSASGSGTTNSATNAAPVFSDTTVTLTLAENTAAGNDVGAAVAATDADGDTLTYTLGGTDAASFDIVSTSGQIRTKTGATYDYEAKSSYSVTVTAADTSNATATATVTINLTNQSEPPQAPAAPTVTTVSRSSLSVTWTAPDNSGRPTIASYDLRYRPGSGEWADGPQDQTALTVQVDNLDGGVTYEVQVRATNSDGNSAWSASGSATTLPALSNDTRLSTLTVSPKDIRGFLPRTNSYQVGVASTVSTVTLEYTQNHSGQSVAVTPADADLTTAGHQVSITSARTMVSIVVTAEDGTTTRTYELTVYRGSSAPYAWKASNDIFGLTRDGNGEPRGLTSDGTTMWMVDHDDAELLAYNLSDRTRNSGRDLGILDLDGNNHQGIWSDGTTLWVGDYAQRKLYGYWAATGNRRSSQDYTSLRTADNNRTTAMWSDGTTMWVAHVDNKIDAYKMSDKSRDSSKDFTDLSVGSITGIWSDGTTMWVLDPVNDNIYAYKMSDKTADSTKNFNTLSGAGNTDAYGMWSDYTTMYVLDDSAARVFSYNLPVYAVSASVDGTALEITFSQDLESAPSLTNSAFTVARTPEGGSETTIPLTGSPSISDNTVTLTLTSETTARDTSITVSYTKPGGVSSRLENSGGNEVAAFTDLAVTRVNEAPVFSDTTVTRTLAENTAAATDIGSPVAATDADPLDTLTYTLGGADAASFAIVSTSGQLRTKAGVTYDFEQRSSYSVTVTATDGTDTDSATVTITVTDVDEPPSAPTLTAVSAVTGSAASLTATWTAPTNTGKPPITGYDLRYRSGSGAWTDGPQDQTGLTATISGLSGDTTYEVQVRATNDEGDSPWSASRSGGTLSSDATLSSLSVSPTDIVGFRSSRLAYEAGVASTVTSATVTFMKNNSGADVDITPADADAGTGGHQVSLTAGRNRVSLEVTAQDGGTTRTYTVSINRGVTTEYGWKADDDFDGLTAAGNEIPESIWSDGTTMWIADGNDNKLYAYELSDQSRDGSKDFDLHSDNAAPRGHWSDGATMWVADRGDDKIYAYRMSDQVRDSSKDFDLHADNNEPSGLWSDGTTMWVADRGGDKIFAYRMSDQARDTSEEFDTLAAAGNTNPWGIWSDGITMWVADPDTDKIYAYRTSDGARASGRDFDTLTAAENGLPTGIWSDGATMWVADRVDAKVYSYNHPVYAVSASVAGTSLTITFSQNLAAAANLANSAFTVEKTPSGGSESVVTLSGSPSISGKTVTLTLSAAVVPSDTGTKVSYTPPTSGSNNRLAGSGSNEVTMFEDLAVDRVNTAPAFSPSSLSRTLAENTAANTDIGSPVAATDADTGDTLAYTLGGADAASFAIVSTSGQLRTKSGVTYDFEADTSYTVTVTATDLAGATATATVTITVTDVDEPPSAPTLTAVSAVTGSSTTLTVVWTAPTNTGKPPITSYDLRYRSGSGAWTDGPQNQTGLTAVISGLAAGTDYEVQVRATNDEGDSPWSSARTAATLSSDATLSSLSVSPTDIVGFTAGRLAYEAGVASTVTSATVTFMKNQSGADVDITPADADAVTGGHQVNLSAGRNRVSIEVTAQDGTTTRTYTLSINRGVTTEYGWKAGDDFDGLVAAGNEFPLGIWSDGTTMWVVDRDDDKVYAYKLSDGTRESSKDFDLHADNHEPFGLWSDGTTMWVVNDSAFFNRKLFAYKLSDGTRESSKDIDLFADNGDAKGIWSDGTTMWVADSSDDEIFAYKLSDGSRDSSKDFDLHADNSGPHGIWSDGTTMWVADNGDDKLFAYRLSDGSRDPGRDFNTLTGSGNTRPNGIWSDGTTMWVADSIDEKVYSYNHPVYATSASVEGTSLVVTFSQDLAAAANLANSAFTVEKTPSGGSESEVTLSGSPSISGKTATLTLSAAVAATDTDVKVSYTPPTSGSNNKLAGTGGNEVTMFEDLAVGRVNRAPAFSPSSVSRTLPENSAAGTDIGSPVAATDADSGDTLTYTLGGADAASFAIVSTSGQLRTRPGVAYDFETDSSLTVTVTATDLAGATGTATVTVTLTDVDEPPSAPTAPRVSSPAGTSTVLSVRWSAPTNTGPSVTGYDLRYRQGSGAWIDGPADVTSTSATISDLVAEATYQVQVRATNDEGTSAWSASGSGVTGDPDSNVVLRGVYAYWRHPEAAQNVLRTGSCAGEFDFRIILSKNHRTPEEWELSFRSYARGDQITSYEFVNTGPGHTHVDGTVRFAPGVDSSTSRGFTITVRGRWGTHWSTWTPRASLYCR